VTEDLLALARGLRLLSLVVGVALGLLILVLIVRGVTG